MTLKPDIDKYIKAKVYQDEAYEPPFDLFSLLDKGRYLDIEIRVLGTSIVKILGTNLYSFLVSSCYQQLKIKTK